VGVLSLFVLVGLLVLPTVALWRWGLDVRWVGAYAIVLNVFTYWMYSLDKKRAQNGEWRVAETRLHLLELLGGWPGAWHLDERGRRQPPERQHHHAKDVLSARAAVSGGLADIQLARRVGV
jgi:4-amino-4-deoxy-L-arabinose transferase-like glycosyltransferase